MPTVTTPFSAATTASEIVEGVDLHGRRAVVTGAGSGIGLETASALALAGAEVTLAVRTLATGQAAAARITSSLPPGAGRVDVRHLDLADRASIAAFVRHWQGKLDILVNNAGVMGLPALRRTPEGWELQFATNHLGHFALATGLHPALASAGGARVVSVSSIGHLLSPVIFDDLHFRFRPYDAWAAYGQSKTANVLFAVGGARRWADDGITVNALMPGNVAETGLLRNTDEATLAGLGSIDGLRLPPGKTIPQGAATSVLLAASPLSAGVSGRYFEDCREADVVTDNNHVTSGVAAYAMNTGNADRLWEVSSRLVS